MAKRRRPCCGVFNRKSRAHDGGLYGTGVRSDDDDGMLLVSRNKSAGVRPPPPPVSVEDDDDVAIARTEVKIQVATDDDLAILFSSCCTLNIMLPHANDKNIKHVLYT